MKNFGTRKIVILLLTACTIAFSCKKTEYIPTRFPYTDVESFSMLGYAGDTVKGVISKDTIYVYWDAAAAFPQTITPVIKVSERATVSPGSGTAIPFSGSAAFTVTAEDGTTKKYTLTLLRTQAVPVVSNIYGASELQWLSDNMLSISGQYFLATGDTSAIKVYAQRVKDGFEFDLIVQRETTNSVWVTAKLPDYTSEMDTGRHNFKLTIGQHTVDLGRGYIGLPTLYNATLTLLTPGNPVYAGDVLTIKIDDGRNNKIFNLYKGKFQLIRLAVYTSSTDDYRELEITEIEQVDNTLKFKLPEEMKNFAGYYVYDIMAGYPYPQPDGNSYLNYNEINPNVTDTLYVSNH
jgi:hypothetical protein